MKKLYGWVGKILRVDLSEAKISELETEEYNERFIGGIGIGQKFYWDEASPELDAFHPDSPLILMTGPLAATSAPSAPRLVACGKSPAMYPEVFNSASIGGFFAAELKKAGYDGIVIKGKASQPLYLIISNEKVELKDDRLPETQFIEREERLADVFGIHNPELFLPGSGDEIISRKGKALEKDKFEKMLDEYYELRGWDKTTGLVKKETLKELSLTELIEPLKKKVI